MKVLTFIFRQRGVLSNGFEIRIPVTVAVAKTWIPYQHIMEFDLVAISLEKSYHSPVQLLPAGFVEEYIVDARKQCAHCHKDNTKKIHSMLELFYLIRVGLYQMVEGAEN